MPKEWWSIKITRLTNKSPLTTTHFNLTNVLRVLWATLLIRWPSSSLKKSQNSKVNDEITSESVPNLTNPFLDPFCLCFTYPKQHASLFILLWCAPGHDKYNQIISLSEIPGQSAYPYSPSSQLVLHSSTCLTLTLTRYPHLHWTWPRDGIRRGKSLINRSKSPFATITVSGSVLSYANPTLTMANPLIPYPSPPSSCWPSKGFVGLTGNFSPNENIWNN